MATTETKILPALFNLIVTFVRTALIGFIMLLGVGGLIAIAGGAISYLFGSYIVAGIGSALISLGAQFVIWTGSIFNYFIEHLITKFSVTLQSLGIMEGIDVVWTAFRDVANIALIGLFVFLAINIILGIKSYGEKKTVAKVLIIAVLLNFSLLFTKVIIDSTNFVAYQFYKSAGLPENSSSAESGGVADAFLAAAGITTIGDTAAGLKTLSDSKGTATALGFTVVAIFLLFMMIGLFVYGAFQVIARSIFLVFLMVVSPLAFVSWIVPANKVEMTWSKWWQSLISAAFFAPLFMMALWASMMLLQQIAQRRGNTSLGEFFTNGSANTDAWSIIFVYCFAVGLLYASIKFASTFSSSIAGYGYAASIAGLPFLSTLAVGNRALRFAGRQTFGKAGMDAHDTLRKNAALAEDGSWRQWLYGRGAQGFQGLAKRDFDAMGVKKVGDKLTKAFGGTTPLSLQGAKLGGFEGIQKSYAKSAEEFAKRIALSDEEKVKAKAGGIEKTMGEDDELNSRYKKVEANAKAAEERLKSEQADATKKMADAAEKIANARATGDDTGARAAQREFDKENQRIKTAQQEAKKATEGVHAVLAQIEEEAKKRGHIPDAAYKSKADIGKAYVDKSLYALLLKATKTTKESRTKLAGKVEDALGGPKAKSISERRVVDYVKDMAKSKRKAEVSEKKALGMKIGDDDKKDAAPPAPKADKDH